jgi:hypothetical protein
LDLLNWPNVFLAALGLISTTALTILVTRFINWALDRRSQLIVLVQVNEVLRSPKLLTALKDEITSAVSNYEQRIKLPLYRHDKFSKFFETEQFIKLELTNKTSKKITGLTISTDTVATSLMQVGNDGEMVEFPGRTPTALGDLQPNRSIIVNVLVSSLFSTYTFDTIKKAVVFSSDEHVRKRYSFPAPKQIEFHQSQRRRLIYLVLWMLFMTCFVVALSSIDFAKR